jgi:putative (di)nucleoside polyphosphate hydrolase
MPMNDLSRHRPNVGVVLFHPDGRVWYGRRAGPPDPYNWQFPQGGVDEGEDYEVAARRELAEETGVVSIEPLASIEPWIAYDFPPGIPARPGQDWVGQKQKWFAFRFTGVETEIRLDRHEEVEFEAWRWGPLEEAPDLVIPFKRDAYKQVVAAFAPLIV